MYDSTNKQLTFIIYDGIENSVFESQVLIPLLSRLEQSPNLEITLVSFEKKMPNSKTLITRIPAHDRLHLVICRRLPFFGTWSLKFAVFQLKRLFRFIPSNQIIARGPLAGHITLTALNYLAKKYRGRIHATSTEKFPDLTIQARGLCAEEHRYALKAKNLSWIDKLKENHIYKNLKQIEWEVYNQKNQPNYTKQVGIEAVSTTLKDYLVAHFRADGSKITIAIRDLPKSIPPEQVATWRNEVRIELGIPQESIVYCYAGSFKMWQCAHETIAAFAYEYSRNEQCFMLVLTQDQEPFITELKRYKLPPTNYKVITVRPINLYRYLSAGDFGMLLRERDIINWVSRPTKMLEYQAVGLKIIHNNTVAWLAHK